MLAVCLLATGCISSRSPQASYDKIRYKINHGDLKGALIDVNSASTRFGSKSAEWQWRFRILKAQILISQSSPREALQVLDEEALPDSLASTEVGVRKLLFAAYAHKTLREFAQADQLLAQASYLAGTHQPQMMSEVINAQGGLEITEGKYAVADETLGRALQLARQQGNSLQEASILLNMTVVATNLEHYDQTMDRGAEALKLSRAIGSQSLVGTNLGNMGWAAFELGDFENALALYKEGGEVSERSGMNGYSAYWFNGVANTYAALHQYAAAEAYSKQALNRARDLNDVATITDCLSTLAELSLREGKLDQAEKYNDEALPLEEKGGDDFGIRESTILAGRIETLRRHFAVAEKKFQVVSQDPKAETPLRWEVHARLAELHDAEGLPEKAEREYRESIDTIETARESLDREDLRLSYLAGGIEFYDDYLDFLIRRHRPLDALKVAELSRARTLVEGLSTDGKPSSRWTLKSKPEEVAQRQRATILFYWMGTERSYVWAITPNEIKCLELPKSSEVEPLVKSYQRALLTIRGPEDADGSAGKQLFETLVGPVRKLIPRESRVIVLPDASLSVLNFETLIAPDPQPHFWIEDVTLTTASSLTLLAASTDRAPSKATNLLLVGNTVQPNDEFPTLAQAPAEMKMIERYFPEQRREVLEGAQATPSAYLESNPERFAYLHFVTHGTASVTRPLESAVILSKEGDSYKLYARDIVKHPLTAQLVTISACEGAGKRAYSGEGLVGLSWAFLRAGAHNVVGALWEVSDSSTPQFMDTFYGELGKGKDPASALRAAKLSLLHSADVGSVFRKPYYWAPFQLYAGS